MRLYLKPASKKFVLDLQEVPSAHLPFKGLIEDGEAWVTLNILPAGVAVSDTTGSKVNINTDCVVKVIPVCFFTPYCGKIDILLSSIIRYDFEQGWANYGTVLVNQSDF